ncbi:MAG: anaerobic sulfatase-maturation protein [Candidatus Latescibacterota bacterium]|nr:anaerobic sulfatase-maturation protein [Candidatus Latescibacterota bacterium]
MTESPSASATEAPAACHVMAKPTGSVCNIDCKYCFYLEKEKLYPEKEKNWRMSDEVLELYVRQYIEAQDVPAVNFAWQGGEPTLMGVDFYRRAVELQAEYADGKEITNAFQTNGILLDDEWGEFLAAEDFLVGLSVDGPRQLHDRYRVDRGQKPTFDRVMAGLEILKKHSVEFNTLTVLHNSNAEHPLEVYRFLKEMGSGFMQFIPIVERRAQTVPDDDLELVGPEFDGRAKVSNWSVGSLQYGRFLCKVFDEWVREDVGKYFVQIFDVSLGSWMGQDASLCIFAETCGNALIIEHNGDLYSCDHFVYPEYDLGNVREQTIREMVASPEQRKFGSDKRDSLPAFCRECDYRFACNGGCPKHRFEKTPQGEDGLNYLCKGYKLYFSHVAPYMEVMADQLQRRLPAANVMEWVRERDRDRVAAKRQPGRNDPCPCGSGRKYKHCCAVTAGAPA